MPCVSSGASTAPPWLVVRTLTCARFLITGLDMVALNLQLLHVRACNAWNVGKVGGRRFGNGGIAAFHQELTVVNHPGTWRETRTLLAAGALHRVQLGGG